MIDRCESALDGVAGAEKAMGEDIDLVVLDMLLPKRSGLELLAGLHRARPALPVIVLTALDEVEQRVTGLDAGAVDYLTKPFSLSELAARIRAQDPDEQQAPAQKQQFRQRQDDRNAAQAATPDELAAWLLPRTSGHEITRLQLTRHFRFDEERTGSGSRALGARGPADHRDHGQPLDPQEQGDQGVAEGPSALAVRAHSQPCQLAQPAAGGIVSSISSKKRIRSRLLRVWEVIACVSPACTRNAANRFIVPLRVYS